MSEEIPTGYAPFGEDDTFIGHVGPIFIRRQDGRATLKAMLARHQCNPLMTAHGGFLMTLMDVTLGCNAGAHAGHAGVYPTVQLGINFLAAARLGETLTGEATVEQLTRTLAFVSGRIHVEGRVVATATAVFRNPPGVGPPRA